MQATFPKYKIISIWWGSCRNHLSILPCSTGLWYIALSTLFSFEQCLFKISAFHCFAGILSQGPAVLQTKVKVFW